MARRLGLSGRFRGGNTLMAPYWDSGVDPTPADLLVLPIIPFPPELVNGLLTAGLTRRGRHARTTLVWMGASGKRGLAPAFQWS
jgi:hypothetical protein